MSLNILFDHGIIEIESVRWSLNQDPFTSCYQKIKLKAYYAEVLISLKFDY